MTNHRTSKTEAPGPQRIHALAGALAASLVLWAGVPAAWTADRDEGMPFKAAEMYIEYNSSAGDTGVQVFLDDDNWRRVTISDPNERTIFVVKGKKTLGRQGLTELFFESVEPELAALPMVQFLARFPEGEYEFEAIRNDGGELESAVEFTHVIPCGPEVDPAGEVLDPGGEVVVSWVGVTQVVDPDGTDQEGETICRDTDALAIETYQVIVEGPDSQLIVDLNEEARALTIPAEIIEPNAIYVFEVLAKEASGNQTITESYFCTGPGLDAAGCLAMAEAL